MSASSRSTSAAFALALFFWPGSLAARPLASAPPERSDPRTPLVIDDSTRIDVNNIAMFVTNTGSFALDKVTLAAGFEFPKGTGKTALFAAGLWLGAKVNGGLRLAISEYSDEYRPGAAVGGVPDDPDKPEYKVYKLDRVYNDATARDAALADYDGRRDDVGRLQ